MAENRQEILDGIATALAGITTGGGYRTTVAAVLRTLEDYDRQMGRCPAVCFAPSEVQVAPIHIFGGRDESLTVRVVFHVDADDADDDTAQAARTAALSDLEADITDAMLADPTWGGWAIDTIKTSGPVTEEGVPRKGGTTGGVASGTLDFRMSWFV